jgi:hypothetical protein
MKKLLSLTLALFCICSAVPAALAAGLTYELPELNMTIDAPEGWIVFSRDIDEDDPNLELTGSDSKTLEDHYKENNIYLNIIKTSPLAEIVITMGEDDNSRKIYDFNRIPDADMQAQAESLMQEMQRLMEGQAAYYDCSVYKHEQAAFFIFHLTQQINGSTVYGKQYTTIINGKTINITLHSYEGEISDSLAGTLQDTIDSVTFTEVTSKPGIDFSEVLQTAAIGGAAGGIGGLIVYLIRKGKKKNYPPAGTGGHINGPGNM